MTIKICTSGWSEELKIETPNGIAKVRVSGLDILIEREDILREIGLSLSDALALFFDKAASQGTREKFPIYISRQKRM